MALVSRNKKLLQDFTQYCNKYPQMRFWQALISWSGWNFIYVSKIFIANRKVKDTFHWEKKDE